MVDGVGGASPLPHVVPEYLLTDQAIKQVIFPLMDCDSQHMANDELLRRVTMLQLLRRVTMSCGDGGCAA